jgi:hypothetical protein
MNTHGKEDENSNNEDLLSYLSHFPRPFLLSFRRANPFFSLLDVLCDPTDLIWRKGTAFETMTDRTFPSLDGLLAEVFRGFPQL